MKDKKLGGRPKLASYQKRTKCFRVMFTENDYIYIQSKAEQAGLSVNEFCHQAAMDCQVCQRISPEMVSAIRDLSGIANNCLLYTSPSPRDVEESRMPSSA